ncbi:MAG TPA: hypothetical protein VEM36_15320, partial [Xanthobacteraceae bacterium]|nr:hypothetical protein [Xanthobacteraceae bacterium]
MTGPAGVRLDILCPDSPHPDRKVRQQRPDLIAHADRSRHDGAGDHDAGAGDVEASIDRQPEMAAVCAQPSAACRVEEMRLQLRDAGPGDRRNRKDRRVRQDRSGGEDRDLLSDLGDTRGGDAIDLGQGDGPGAHAEQVDDGQMLAALRHGAVVGGDDEQDEIDAGDAAQHVADEALVSGNVDEADALTRFDRQVGEAQVDRHAAPLLLGQPVGVDAGERLDQQRLAVIDVAGGGNDHVAGGSGNASCDSWAVNRVSSSRQRRSRMNAPRSIRPITGTGRVRKACVKSLSAVPVPRRPVAGLIASPALAICCVASAPLPISLLQSTTLTAATPPSRAANAGCSLCAILRISANGRASARSAGSRS